MPPVGPTHEPVDAPGGWDATRQHVALTQLLQSLGPFDDLKVSLTFRRDEGWCEAAVACYRGDGEVAVRYVPLGSLCTDPVLFMLVALGTYAQRWHNPTLFESV